MKLRVFHFITGRAVFCFSLFLLFLPAFVQTYGYGSLGTTSAIVVLAANEKNTLEVKCVDQAGNPLKGIRVEAIEMTEGKKKRKKCNAAGVAYFNKLDTGVYELVARQKGFDPSVYDFVLLEGGSNESVTMVFKPGDKDKLLYFEDAMAMQQAQQQLDQSFPLLEAKKFAQAEELLKASSESNPSDPRAFLFLSNIYLQQGQWDQAKEVLEKAVIIAQAQVRITAAQFERQAKKQSIEYDDGGKLARVTAAQSEGQANPYEPFYQQAVDQLNSLPVSQLSSEGFTALQNKDFETAVAKFQQVVALRSDNSDFLFNLATAQAGAGLYDEALESVGKALQLKPTDKGYANFREGLIENKQKAELAGALAAGDKHFKEGNHVAALEEYMVGLPLVPENVQHRMWDKIAETHGLLNQPDEVAQAYRQAIQLAPDNSEYVEKLVAHYTSQGQIQEAIGVYVDLFNKGSEPIADSLFSKAQEFVRKAKPELAQVAYEKTLETDPGYVEAIYELGMLYFYDVKDTARSREMLTQYIAVGKDAAHISNAESVLAVMGIQQKN